LAVSLPPKIGDKPLLALPLVLPMGWTKSPPYFCTARETGANITNWRLTNHWKAPPHRLEVLANSKPATDDNPQPTSTTTQWVPSATAAPATRPHNRPVCQHPLKKVDLFVDNFITMGHGNPAYLSKIRQTLLHRLDKVFRGRNDLDGLHCKEPASTSKKLSQGDTHWDRQKLILGWIIDTTHMTLELLPHCKERLQAILDNIPSCQKQISVKKWQQVLGKFLLMAIAISLMQEAPNQCPHPLLKS
jgi:hypothetical protein